MAKKVFEIQGQRRTSRRRQEGRRQKEGEAGRRGEADQARRREGEDQAGHRGEADQARRREGEDQAGHRGEADQARRREGEDQAGHRGEADQARHREGEDQAGHREENGHACHREEHGQARRREEEGQARRCEEEDRERSRERSWIGATWSGTCRTAETPDVVRNHPKLKGNIPTDEHDRVEQCERRSADTTASPLAASKIGVLDVRNGYGRSRTRPPRLGNSTISRIRAFWKFRSSEIYAPRRAPAHRE